MSLYYFDTQDGPTVLRDDTGTDLDGIEAAQREAVLSVPDLIRETPIYHGREIVLTVRDENETVFQVTVQFATSP